MKWMTKIGLLVSLIGISGCVAELFVIRTIEEIKRSNYQAERVSTKPPDVVTTCMVDTLYTHTDTDGSIPYAAVKTQRIGSTQAITLRTGHNIANTMYGGGNELLFLIDNTAQSKGGTKSTIWVNQNLLPTQPYLDRLVSVVQTCL